MRGRLSKVQFWYHHTLQTKIISFSNNEGVAKNEKSNRGGAGKKQEVLTTTSLPQLASCTGYHGSVLCTNKLQALLCTVSLMSRTLLYREQKKHEKNLSLPQSMHTGLHFQSVSPCRRDGMCASAGMCTGSVTH